ncbi:hypothetical protein L873DRAFT_1808043 [Choiromyces venosus 120613-1]|uniref:DUF7580 domain-containing protein n=1 Tax=Choiromyces venosus 120613-1 TaxID=1336337 RepID=A0A3N4JN89_9PEZI|nr:hypothetical protein L873DRAFT_1808043 [Choiromyces venosus 120613-1]
MEAAGLAFGTTAVFTLANGCLGLIRFVSSLPGIPAELATHHAMFQFESVLYTLWWEEVFPGSTQPTSTSTSTSTSALQDLSVSHFNIEPQLKLALTDLHGSIVAIENIFRTYKVDVNDPAADFSSLQIGFRKKALHKLALHKESVESQLTEHIDKFRYWNSALRSLLSYRQQEVVKAGLVVGVLKRRATEGDLVTVWDAAAGATKKQEEGEKYAQLRDAAEFQIRRLKILSEEEQAEGGASVELGLKRSLGDFVAHKVPEKATDNLRIISRLKSTSTPYLFEYKLHPPNPTTLPLLLSRLETLSRILSLASKPENLLSLNCKGYVSTPTSLALIYSLPPSSNKALPTTLHSAYTLKERKRPSLPQRLNLARTLAKGLLSFHTFGWLHKSFHSKNVLFFEDANDNLVFASPYISGFEYARPSDPKEMTVSVSANPDAYLRKFACHPDLGRLADVGGGMPRFEMRYDVYGLGLMLLEIAIWKPIDKILEEEYLSEAEKHSRNYPSGKNLEKRWLKVCRDLVAHRMGREYRDATKACLTWENGKDGEAFLHEVVGRLEKCFCKSEN